MSQQSGQEGMAMGSLEGTRSVERSTVSTVAEGPEWFGGESAPDIASSSSKPALVCEYFSARTHLMIESKSEYVTAVDAEIEASKVHWSELREAEGGEEHCVGADNLAFFRSLQEEYINAEGKCFFKSMSGLDFELGEKIAEGAQGAIYRIKGSRGLVKKVFKLEGGLSLEALHKQWPQGMLNAIQNDRDTRFGGGFLPHILGAEMLNDGRFGFIMGRYWGDLRKLIDERMVHNGNQSSPFSNFLILQSVYGIAQGMRELHRHGIVHGDLKASNVLVLPWIVDDKEDLFANFNPLEANFFSLCVADFECAIGVVGTRFWRAPEILIALKEHRFKPNLCTEKSDVYSFGMTCYEIITGKIPLEEERPNNYDIVLGGKRPELPSNTYLFFRSMLERCWHHESSERPSFEEIVEKMNGIKATHDAVMKNGGENCIDVLKSKF